MTNRATAKRCDLTIARLHGAQDGKVVRIDATDGRLLLARIEVPLEDFAACLMGLGMVEATFAHRPLKSEERTE